MTTFDEGHDAPGLLPYRVRQLERFSQDMNKWKGEVDEDRTDLKYVRKDMRAMQEAMEDVKKILVRASVTVAGSAVMILVSVLLGTGKIG